MNFSTDTFPETEFDALEIPLYAHKPSALVPLVQNNSLVLPASVARPIQGEVIPTSNILIRITKKADNSITVEWIGIVSKTTRFRGLADFQFFPNPNMPSVGLFDNIHSSNLSPNIPTIHSKELGGVPPPLFSKTALPFKYNYRENPSVARVPIPSDGEPRFALHNIFSQGKSGLITVNLSEQAAPAGPQSIAEPARASSSATKPTPTSGRVRTRWERIPFADPSKPPIQHNLELIESDASKLLKELFEKRPIYSRIALTNHIALDFPTKLHHILRKILPKFAYASNAGPWRNTLIRFGYDPKTNPEARIYQSIDMRFVQDKNAQPNTPAKASSTSSQQNNASQQTASNPEEPPQNTDNPLDPIASETPNNPAPLQSHIFDGTQYANIALVQICDVTDPKIVPLIQSSKYFSDTCSERDGWFVSGHVSVIRNALTIRVREIRRKSRLGLSDQPSEPSRGLNDEVDQQERETGLDATQNQDQVILPKKKKKSGRRKIPQRLFTRPNVPRRDPIDVVDQDEEEDLEETDEDADDDDDDGDEAGTDDDDPSASNQYPAVHVSESVQSKVDELMRSLRLVQRTDAASNQEEDDYFDLLESESILGDQDDD